MPRPNWVEWEGQTPAPLDVGVPAVVLTVLGHPDGVEALRASLVQELAQSGVADTMGIAYGMASAAVLSYGWYGYIEDDSDPVWCLGSGLTIDEETVDRALPCVYALITA